MKSLLTTKASTTEEPREGKLHAGICAGDAEQSVFLPRLHEMIIEFKLTYRNIKEAEKIIDKVSFYQYLRGYITQSIYVVCYVFILLGVMLFYMGISSGEKIQTIFIVSLVFFLGGFILFFFTKKIVTTSIKKKSMVFNRKISYEIKAGELVQVINNGPMTIFKPSDIQRIIDSSGYILLFIEQYRALVIPASAFQSEEQRGIFMQLICEQFNVCA